MKAIDNTLKSCNFLTEPLLLSLYRDSNGFSFWGGHKDVIKKQLERIAMAAATTETAVYD